MHLKNLSFIIVLMTQTFSVQVKKKITLVMNNELQRLVDWLRANKLSLKESKTKLITFHPLREKCQGTFDIKLNKKLVMT